MSTFPMKRSIRRFHVVVVQCMSKKCTKKRDAPAELFFYYHKTYCFFEVVVVVVVVVAEAPYWHTFPREQLQPGFFLEAREITLGTRLKAGNVAKSMTSEGNSALLPANERPTAVTARFNELPAKKDPRETLRFSGNKLAVSLGTSNEVGFSC